jgi:O-antigen ligase
MTGFTPAVNNLAGLAATALAPALMIAVDADTKRRRYLGACAVGFVGAGILLSGSIGGLTAATISTLFWLSIRGFSPRLVVGLGAVIAAAVILMTATGSTSAPSPIQRISRVTSPTPTGGAPDKGSVFTRLDGYRLAWARIRDHPFVGVGLDEASSADVLEGHFAHNIILNPWFTAGILGLAGIVFIIGGAFGTARRVIRGSPAEGRNFAAAMMASLLAFVVFAMGEPILFVRYGWFPVAMLVALRAQQLRAVHLRSEITKAPRALAAQYAGAGVRRAGA